MLEKAKNLLRDRWLSFYRTEHTFLLFFSVIIGVISGLGAVAFRYMILFFQHLFYGPFSNYLQRLMEIPWYHKLLVPAAVGLLLGPITYFFKEIKGHGVPEVMESVVLKGGRLRHRVFPLKALASSLCIASGGSVGREGPIVMIGASMGSTIGQMLNVSTRRMRIFVACGAAGGIAATFNAPIAGVIFALEVIIGEFDLEHFSPIVICSVIATAISHWFLGNVASFAVAEYRLVSFYELINYAVLGLFAAFVSLFYVNFLYKTEQLFQDWKLPDYFKPAVGGLVIGCIGIFYPQVFGVGYESVDLILSGKQLVWYLLVSLVFLKIFATSITLASGGSGGVFAPSLFIGATFGGAMGYLFNALMPGLTAPSGAYAMVGMGAVVAGAIHAPFSAIMIIFEMTNDYNIILPLMIACIISTVTARGIQRDSIYTMKLSRRGINIFGGRELNVLRSLFVRDVMTQDINPIPEYTPLPSLINLLIESKYFYFPMIDRNGSLTGIFSLNDIRRFIREEDYLKNLIIAKDIAHEAVVTTNPDENLGEVVDKFAKLDIDEIPVVDVENPRKVIGMVKRSDVIDRYNREMSRRNVA